MNSHPKSNNLNSIAFFTNYGKDPCAHLRVRGPLSRLGIKIIEGVENKTIFPGRASLGDLVLIQRDFPKEFSEYSKVVQNSQKAGIPIVFDIDDLLFSLPENHPERLNQHYTESLLPMLQALYEVNAVTVTTNNLKTYLSKFNNHIFVLPNYFDDSIWSLRKPIIRASDESPIIIGYMGTDSHLPDLESIAPVFQRLIDLFPAKIQFCFWGIKPPAVIGNYGQVTWVPAEPLEYAEFARYFQKQKVDIFISPLVDNPFNRSKSPLKFFEYTALGAPGVYSRLGAYEEVITDGIDGLLASTQEEWLEKLVDIIQNKEKRYQLAINAQETVRSKWLLSHHFYEWGEAYEQIISSKSDRSPEENAAIALVKSITNQYYQGDQAQIDRSQLRKLSTELGEIKRSKAWKIALLIRRMGNYFIPPNTARAKIARKILFWLRGQNVKVVRKKSKARLATLLGAPAKIINCKEISQHSEPIDVVICIHNALPDVRKCLESVKTYSTPPFSVILVDDGSDELTRDYLQSFAASEPWCTLIRNDQAKGYTLAANIGMRHSKAPYIILLNSDTIVGPEWLDRLYRAMTADEKIGVVGPLSNTASWQSVPNLMEDGDWAVNAPPTDVTAVEMAKLISRYSQCIHPEVPLLNGFSLMIRRKLIDEIGYFDEDNFGQGYGEEDDFNIRAGDAGWKKIIADDVYIYHAQSKSYSASQRFDLSRQSGEKLIRKHGINRITEDVAFMNPNRVLEGIRCRTNIIIEREKIVEKGKALFSGKKVLFVLPVQDPGGGANVVIDEARSLIRMDVDARIFNLQENKSVFQQNYSNLDIPVVFGDESDFARIAAPFDAVIATADTSVELVKSLQTAGNSQILGYYVQDFEPLFYPEGSAQAQKALATYTLIDPCKCFTKTRWTQKMLIDKAGVKADVAGISVNIDLFHPRDMLALGEKPVNIVAMIRPTTSYRNPELTMDILKQIANKYSQDVTIWLFGTNDVRESMDPKYLDFDWKQLGRLNQNEVASVLSKADIFTDFSSHQAMGLTALEAMSSGCIVIVPRNGGAVEFVRHHENGIIVDTANYEGCVRELETLIKDDNLRKQFQLTGMRDVVQYYPEKVGYNILSILFGKQ